MTTPTTLNFHFDEEEFKHKMTRLEKLHDVKSPKGNPTRRASNWKYLKDRRLDEEHVHQWVSRYAEDMAGETHAWGVCQVCGLRED
jgi:hypothetical protein